MSGIEQLPEPVEAPPARPVQWWRVLLTLGGAGALLAALVIGGGWAIGELSRTELWQLVQTLFEL